MLCFSGKRRYACFWSRLALIVGTLGVFVAPSSTWAGEALDPFRWKYRVIIVDAYDADESVVSMLEDASTEIDARQVLWFVLGDKGVVTNFEGQLPGSFVQDLHQSGYLNNTSRAVLIGKDGGVKKRDTRFNLQEMLALIDTMPMRQREMQDQIR